jgi:hypothetical protein
MSSSPQSSDPRIPADPNFEQYGWALPKRKSLDGDEDLDGYLAIAPVLGSMGLFLKIESLSWMAVTLALLSLGSRKVEGYKWSSFMMILMLGLAGVFTIVITEMRPQLAETAAAAARGGNPLQQVLKTLQLDKVLKSFGVQL